MVNRRLTVSRSGTLNRLSANGMPKRFRPSNKKDLMTSDNGMPISTLQKLMGHSDIQTTAEYYIKSTDANEQRACEKLDEIMGRVKQTDNKLTLSGNFEGQEENRRNVSS
jgi:integrase